MKQGSNFSDYKSLTLWVLFVGGIFFTFGLVVGYYLSRSSYEQIISEAVLESPGKNGEKIAVFNLSGNEEYAPVAVKKPSAAVSSAKTERSVSSSPKRSSTPRPISPSSYRGKYSVQVGAFKKRADAARLQKRLNGKGYDVFVVSARVEGKGVWYRVRSGRFKRKKEAESLAGRLFGKEKIKGLVIKNE